MKTIAWGIISILCWISFAYPGLAQTSPPDFLLDHNQDGAIDSKDLLLLLRRWGQEGIATPTPTPVASETPTNANEFTVDLPNPFPLRMIRIPAGSFMMGSPDTERSRETDEGPVHQVTIPNEFFMGQTEVTRAQWETVMGPLPPIAFGVGANHPVPFVSWLECQNFLVALNTLSGEGNFRLPSEAEWEYACRAGSSQRFYFGDSLGCADDCEDCQDEGRGKELPWVSTNSALDFEPKLPLPLILFRSDFMWFCGANSNFSQQVRSLRPNAFGLFDMSGNVLELVQDAYHTDYSGAPTDGSAWVEGGSSEGGISFKVVRGGSFVDGAEGCRSAWRARLDPAIRLNTVGFRVVWTPQD